jgi:hypothetical protein
MMVMKDELTDALAIMRSLVDDFFEKAETGDRQAALDTIIKVVGALRTHGESRGRGAPVRGLGYAEDEAQIVASLQEHKNSLTKAARAHYPDRTEDEIKVIVKRIRRHMKEIDAFGLPDVH